MGALLVRTESRELSRARARVPRERPTADAAARAGARPDGPRTVARPGRNAPGDGCRSGISQKNNDAVTLFSELSSGPRTCNLRTYHGEYHSGPFKSKPSEFE